MKAYSLHEIQKELKELPEKDILAFCSRLAKFKVENKELLTYLLFYSSDEEAFINLVKQEAAVDFTEMNRTNLYFAKKTIRKVLRKINKYCRYSGKDQTELELRIYFCQLLKDSGLNFRESKVIENMYEGQLQKIDKVFNRLHEDLQFDYKVVISELGNA